MLVMDRQMRVHLGIHRDGKRQLVNRAVTLLVFELLLLHIAECIIWGIYFYALGVFDQFRVALYFAAVTYTLSDTATWWRVRPGFWRSGRFPSSAGSCSAGRLACWCGFSAATMGSCFPMSTPADRAPTSP